MNGEKEGLENGEEEEEEEQIFYDKAKSFFDNISCESIDRAKGYVIRGINNSIDIPVCMPIIVILLHTTELGLVAVFTYL